MFTMGIVLTCLHRHAGWQARTAWSENKMNGASMSFKATEFTAHFNSKDIDLCIAIPNAPGALLTCINKETCLVVIGRATVLLANVIDPSYPCSSIAHWSYTAGLILRFVKSKKPGFKLLFDDCQYQCFSRSGALSDCPPKWRTSDCVTSTSEAL